MKRARVYDLSTDYRSFARALVTPASVAHSTANDPAISPYSERFQNPSHPRRIRIARARGQSTATNGDVYRRYTIARKKIEFDVRFARRVDLIKIDIRRRERGPILSEDKTPRIRCITLTVRQIGKHCRKVSVAGFSLRVGRYFLRACQRNFRLARDAAAVDDRERATSSENFRRFEKDSIRASRRCRRRVRDFVFSGANVILVKRIFRDANVTFPIFRYATRFEGMLSHFIIAMHLCIRKARSPHAFPSTIFNDVEFNLMINHTKYIMS